MILSDLHLKGNKDLLENTFPKLASLLLGQIFPLSKQREVE